MRVRFDSPYPWGSKIRPISAHVSKHLRLSEFHWFKTEMRDKLVRPVKKKERVNLKFKTEGSQSQCIWPFWVFTNFLDHEALKEVELICISPQGPWFKGRGRTKGKSVFLAFLVVIDFN